MKLLQRVVMGCLVAFSICSLRVGLAEAADIRLLGASTVSLGDVFPVTVQAQEFAAVDTLRLNGSFVPTSLSWDHASPKGVFQNISPGTFVDAKTGRFSFGSYSFDSFSQSGELVTLYFRALKPGKTRIQLDETTKVYQNGVEQPLVRGYYDVTVLSTPVVASKYLQVESASHPDAMTWYAQRNVQLSWHLANRSTAKILVGMDTDPHGVAAQTVQGAQTTLTAERDGVWYAHVKAVYADGTTDQVDLPVRIDTTAPLALQPVAEPMGLKPNMVDVLRFSSLDSASGVDRYEVFLDGALVTSTASNAVLLGNAKPGMHKIRVVAYDRAGNHTEAMLSYRMFGIMNKRSFSLWHFPAWLWVIFVGLLLCLIKSAHYVLSRRNVCELPAPTVMKRSFRKKKK